MSSAARPSARPSGPACRASTQSSQHVVAYIGKAIACLKADIQAPGRGRMRATPGASVMARTGRAKPAPSAMRIATIVAASATSAAPSAAAMKGAVQGVATTTASIPARKAPEAGRVATAMRISKAPERFRATASMMQAMDATKAGDWNWKPHPSSAPAPRNASMAAAMDAKQAMTPSA